MITDAVIPVGGLGTRLLPATRSLPKEMLPLVDKPAVQYVVEEVQARGSSGSCSSPAGGLTFMEFGPGGGYEPLDRTLLPPLVIAWRDDSSSHSGVVHGDLRVRFDNGEAIVVESMTRLAQLARGARAALVKRDRATLVACVGASFDVRRQMMDLDARHVAMIERARACGAVANYTGGRRCDRGGVPRRRSSRRGSRRPA